MTPQEPVNTVLHGSARVSYEVMFRDASPRPAPVDPQDNATFVWVTIDNSAKDYPAAHEIALRAALTYAHVRIVRVEKTTTMTVAWTAEEAL